MLRFLTLLTFSSALALRISPVVRRAPAVSMMQDECVITTLDASASTVFGKHYNMEAVVCADNGLADFCLLYTSPSPRDRTRSRMPSSA